MHRAGRQGLQSSESTKEREQNTVILVFIGKPVNLAGFKTFLNTRLVRIIVETISNNSGDILNYLS